jgi:hypothetical protein
LAQIALKMPNCKWRQKFYFVRVKHSGKAALAALPHRLVRRGVLLLLARGVLGKSSALVLDWNI